MEPISIIIFLSLVAVLLIGVDFFLPGFILGSIGIVLMLAALVVCFNHYGGMWATALFVLQAALGIGAGYATIRYGPHTTAGKRMILAHEQRDQRASANSSPELVGKEGIAESLLRPAGMAKLDGKRLDVIAESGLIERGSAIKVIAVEGTRIIVRKI